MKTGMGRDGKKVEWLKCSDTGRILVTGFWQSSGSNSFVQIYLLCLISEEGGECNNFILLSI